MRNNLITSLPYLGALLLALTLYSGAWAQQTKGAAPVASPASVAIGTTWAVIAGVSDYQNPEITDLKYAHRDAAAFAAYLQSPAGGSVDSNHITLLLNEHATMAQFAAALDWLLEKTKEGDQAIIYFSGHGDVEKKTITQPGFLLCWDAPARVYMSGGAFGLYYLQEVVSTLSLQTKARVLVVTDACRAGKLAGNDIGGTQVTALNLAKQYANEVKIMSCQPEELSLEGAGWGGGRGVFSFFLLNGMAGLADRNADGTVNLQEIERYLEDQVPAATAPHPQNPMAVGNKSALVSKVDPAALAALQHNHLNQQSETFLASNDKGVLDALEKSADPSTLALYQDFKKALKEGRLLAPEPGCAWNLYNQLKDKTTMAPFEGLMRRNLAAALQDEAQQAVNDYLKADPAELRRRWGFSERYDRFPDYLDKAAELLGPEHLLYKALKARAHYFAGLNYRLRGERTKNSALYKSAQAEQLECLKQEPNAAFAYNEMGLLARRQKNLKESVTQFEKAIAIAPAWALPWANLCGSYYELDAFDKAEIAGKQAVHLDSNLVLAQYNLGVTYRYIKDASHKAKAHLSAAIRRDPDYANAYDQMGHIYFDEKNYAQAEKWWLFYLQRAPDDLYNMVNLGEACLRLGKKDEAMAYFERALKKDPDFYPARQSVGAFYLSESRYAEAESAFWRCVEINPADPDAYYALACIKTQQNQPDQALKQLERALENGFKDQKTLQEDPLLAPLRQEPGYKALLAKFFP